jgi:tetratricopeptide (TPR) repeat protein
MKPLLILFVHGLGATSQNTWGRFREFLEQDAELGELADVKFFGFKTSKTRWSLFPSSRKQKISDLAKGLRTEIDERYRDYEWIVPVGHSMGGLVIRQYLVSELRNESPLRVKKVVLFAVPNQGSEMAAVANLFSIVHAQLADLTPDSPFLESLNTDWREFNVDAHVDVTHVVAGLDEAVREQSALGLWGRPRVKLVADRSHSGLVDVGDRDDLAFLILRNLVLDFARATISSAARIEDPKPRPAPSAEPRSVVRRPAIANGPTLNANAPYVQNFVGRHVPLGTFEDALSGLLRRSRHDLIGTRAERVRLLWVYGFGGMGKTWFLRHAAIRALDSDAAVVLVDWDDIEWRVPLAVPPTLPHHIFDALATRLAQVCGTDALNGFWNAESEVRHAADKHAALQFEFSTALNLLADHGSEWRRSEQVILLNTSGDTKTLKLLFLVHELLHDDPIAVAKDTAARRRALQQLRASTARYRALFETWVSQAVGSEATAPVARPVRYLADALRASLARICSARPVLLVLDTCELLSADLDAWLRYVLSPSLSGDELLLVLIGSRLRPDAESLSGAKDSWRTVIPPDRMRVETFNENVSLTVPEIEQLVNQLSLEVAEAGKLAETIHVVSRGVPMAVRLLLEMIDEDSNHVATLSAMSTEDDVGGPDEITQRLIESVSGRFLLHLENQPQHVQDFADVIAVGVLLSPSFDILAQYWGEERARQRLIQLANRYSIFAGGDLHYTIRDYVRRAWRLTPPAELHAIAARLLQAVDTATVGNDEDAERLLMERANILSWCGPAPRWGALAAAAIHLIARNAYMGDFERIITEMRTDSPAASAHRDTLLAAARCAWNHDTAPIERMLQRYAKELTPTDHGLAEMVLGIRLSNRDSWSQALRHFEEMEGLIQTSHPALGRAANYYLAAATMICFTSGDRVCLARAYDWHLRMNQGDVSAFVVGTCLRELGRLDEAEQVYLKAIENDETDDGSAHQLAHLYERQSRADEADRYFRMAAERDERADGNWSCWSVFYERTGNLSRAVETAEKAVAINSENPTRHIRLWRLLKLCGGTTERREQVLADALRTISASEDPVVLNGFAWQLLLAQERISEAAELAKRAIEKVPDDLNAIHTLASILLVQRNWSEARPLVRTILDRTDPAAPQLGAEAVNQVLWDGLQVGDDELLGMLEAPEWEQYRSALLFGRSNELIPDPAMHKRVADMRQAAFLKSP